MSFILDALRKSEHERQRQSGPAIVDVPVATPKPRTNHWATAAVALLVVNLVAVALLLLWRSRDVPEPTVLPTQPEATEPTPAPAAPPVAARPAPSPRATLTETREAPAVPLAAPPTLSSSQAPAALAGSRNPLADEVSGTAPMESEFASAAAAVPAGPPAVTPTRRGSVVYETLPEADPLPVQPQAEPSLPPGDLRPQAARRDLPAADDLAARGIVPEQRLELHVYSNRPQESFVFINSKRYREGDVTQEGARIEEITSDGVVLELRGTRYFMSRD